METEFLIIGSGLTGSVLARKLKDIGKKVLVLERRNHIAGNVYDYYHQSGIRLNKYGPHYFRTHKKEIWDFVNKFSDFYKFEAVVKTKVNNNQYNWPLDKNTISLLVENNWQPAYIENPTNFEEASLKMMPRLIYEKFVKGYNKKQWGIDPVYLSRSLAKRFEVRDDDDVRLMKHEYQGMPVEGYTSMVRNMLKDIPLLLSCDYFKYKDQFNFKRLIYTGSLDEFFEYKYGRLKYRTAKRINKYIPNCDSYQNTEQVNYPGDECDYIRILEWKFMMEKKYSSKIKGTLITYEMPGDATRPEELEYPFPDSTNIELYKRYEKEAKKTPDTIFGGRLGKYKYYDMDIAIEESLKIFNNEILSNESDDDE
ncbi:MAG: NAD(P)-binding protein [Bacteroidetes bacterium]|nr:NAD(P)-binding protein [Bacteroidota bacterium]